jgi:hypothetical protein
MRQTLTLFVACAALLALALPVTLRAASPANPPVWGANVRANTDNSGYGQHEPGLAVSFTNPDVVVVASKDYRVGNVKKVWIDASRDGGQTWPTQLMMPNLPSAVDEYSDPVVMARDDGRIYVSVLARNASTGAHGLWITWTDDNAVTFVPSVAVTYNETASTLDDKEWFAVDNDPASPYYHRLYMTWAPGYTGIAHKYSSDGGSTWSSLSFITAGNDEYAYPVVAPGGAVYAFYMRNWGFCATGTVRFVKSTNGGVTWTTSTGQLVATAYQPCSPPRPQDQWRFYSIITAAADPNNASNLWAAWTDDYNVSGGPTDLLFTRTTDGGTTWSAPARLSHDPAGNGRTHITPIFYAQDLGATTRLHAFWLDRRDDPNDLLFKAWYSSSTDGGVTWDPDQAVSDASFNLNIGLPPGSGNAAGDYWGLAASGNAVYAAWTDTRSGAEQDIYTARGLFGTPATPTPTQPPTATATRTPAPPTATSTPMPPTATSTPMPPTATSTAVPPTATSTSVPAQYTAYIPLAVYNGAP